MMLPRIQKAKQIRSSMAEAQKIAAVTTPQDVWPLNFVFLP